MPGKIYDLKDLENLQLPPLKSGQQGGNAAPAAPAPAPAPAPAAPAPAPQKAAPAARKSSGDSDFELPPLPSANKRQSGKSDDFELPPIPPRRSAPAKDIMADDDDFTLPPIPPRKAAQPARNNMNLDDDFELPPIPARKKEAPQRPAAPADSDLPPMPARPAPAPAPAPAQTYEQPAYEQPAYEQPAYEQPAYEQPAYEQPAYEQPAYEQPAYEQSAYEQPAYEQPAYSQPSYDEEMPMPSRTAPTTVPQAQPSYDEEMPMPSKPAAPAKNNYEIAGSEPSGDVIDDDNISSDYDDDYDMNLDNVTPQSMGLGDPEKALAPMTTKKEAAARNAREKARMDDLANSMVAPVLDDLSDVYTAPVKKAETLLERDQLDDEEKMVLKQRLREDLSRRPENYNVRASQRMESKLMVEQQLKIAKKGMGISFIPIALGLVSSAISFFFLDWEVFPWFQYIAIFNAVGALMLLIKSKQVKIFSTIIYVMASLLYAGPGLLLFAMNREMRLDPVTFYPHLFEAAAAAALTVTAIIILTKNKALNTYYTTSFKRR